jgi:antirestriction protein ArdC
MSNNFKPLSEQVADKLIQQLKDGNSIFQKSDAQPLIMPFNANTGKNYSGVPALILLMKQEPDPTLADPRTRKLQQKQRHERTKKAPSSAFTKPATCSRSSKTAKRSLKENGKPKMVSVKLDEPVLTTAFLFNAKQLKDMPELAARARRTCRHANRRTHQSHNRKQRTSRPEASPQKSAQLQKSSSQLSPTNPP